MTMVIRRGNQPVPSNPDASLEMPSDLEAIARNIPSIPRGWSELRQLIGLLPDQIGPGYPSHQPIAEPGTGSQENAGSVGTPLGYAVGGSAAGGAFNISNIDGSQLVDGSVGGAQIAADAITADKIQANSITASEIQANSIDSSKIIAGTIQASDIQVGTITGLELADGSIGPVEIAYLDASDITVGTLTAISIIGCQITAGSSGIDGFLVKDGSGADVGYWTGAGGLVNLIGGISAFGTTTGQGYVYAQNGVTTWVGSGIGSMTNVTNGTLAIDTGSSPPRLYFRHSAGWHYVAQTAGFTIPAHEARCPSCELLILPGEDVIGVANAIMYDGGVHGLWKHLSCAGVPVGPLAARYELAGGDPLTQADLEAEVLAAQDAALVERPAPPPPDASPALSPPPPPDMGDAVGLDETEAAARHAAKVAQYDANIAASQAARDAEETP